MAAERDKFAVWFAKVEGLEAELRTMTKSRDDWQQRWRKIRQERQEVLDLLREAREWVEDAWSDHPPALELLERIDAHL